MRPKPGYLKPIEFRVPSSEFRVPDEDRRSEFRVVEGNNAVSPEKVYSNTGLTSLGKTQNSELETRNSKLAELRLCLTIMKPITWVPVIWSFWCGAVAGGGLSWTPEGVAKLVVGLLLAGPLLCGMSQAVNDWFDREVDAVNEPWRPIASGQLSIRRIYQTIGTLGFLGLMAAYYLGPVVMFLAFFGIFMAHAYSAPPLRFKRFTWLGPLTSATSYIIVPWLAAASVFGGITLRLLVIGGIYTLGGVGIMILNDFKSIRGDYQLKLPSVPVVYGTRLASRLACGIMDGAQLLVIGWLLFENHPTAAGIIVALMLPQLILQRHFIQKPISRAIWYNARGQNFFVLGMLIAAWLTF
jgi:chlorophyll synthase